MIFKLGPGNTSSRSLPNNNCLLVLCFLIFLIGGCLNNNVKDDNGSNYSIYTLGKDGKNYITLYNTLDSGLLKPESDGMMVEDLKIKRNMIVKNHFFYRLSTQTALFSKYEVSTGAVTPIAELTLKDFTIENYTWISTDTLLLTGLNFSGYNQPKYALINTANMSIIAQGKMGVPVPSGIFGTLSIGFVEKQDNHLLVGYTYHVTQGLSNFKTSDTLYVSKVSYPEMKLLSTDKDLRSTYPGGQNMIQSYTFLDENGDYYFVTCNGIAMGNRPEIPSGIFRIKKGQSTVDKDYFFNITASTIQNHPYGMWYLGQDRVIIRTERKDLFKGLSDHYRVAQFEFYVLNLKTKGIVKLNLPLDKGTRKECVLVQDNIAYIAVNSSKEGNFIWMYDLCDGSLKKGLQLAGNADYILRIDRLQD